MTNPLTFGTPCLHAENLECVRSDRLLFSGLNFELGRGQLLHIEGANGCGKTSLLRILCGLSPPAAGEVRWRGRPIYRERHRFLNELAYLGHHLGVKGELTALENLVLASRLYRTRAGADPDQILIRAGLGGHADTPARALSAGQRQRIALARLLLQEAVLWVLDEPFTSLDQDGIAWVRTLLEAHLERGGIVVMTSHQLVPVQAEVLTLRL
jgi:heme exporter protein A